jgi:hypothetical protein
MRYRWVINYKYKPFLMGVKAWKSKGMARVEGKNVFFNLYAPEFRCTLKIVQI